MCTLQLCFILGNLNGAAFVRWNFTALNTRVNPAIVMIKKARHQISKCGDWGQYQPPPRESLPQREGSQVSISSAQWSRKMVETLPSSEEIDFNLEFYTQKNCQLSVRAKYIISDTQGLWDLPTGCLWENCYRIFTAKYKMSPRKRIHKIQESMDPIQEGDAKKSPTIAT